VARSRETGKNDKAPVQDSKLPRRHNSKEEAVALPQAGCRRIRELESGRTKMLRCWDTGIFYINPATLIALT
jgi:hypothetical protein